MRRDAAFHVGAAIEAGVLALVCLAPWAFGATAPRYVFFLDVGLAGLMALWGARMLLEGQLTWRRCPVGACLVALVLLAAWQAAPLPGSLLRGISPATARMYDQLLPERPEVLPAGEPRDNRIPHAGSTLSFDPGATRGELARLLAVLMLFAIVRNNVDPADGLRRLSVVALANGSLLALFGLVQGFSAAPRTIYWVYPTSGGPFGPFINHNHFAFYMNVCVGLGAGLLLGRIVRRDGPSEGRIPASRADPDSGPSDGSTGGDLRTDQAPPLPLDPLAMGMTFALGLMISSVVFCLSRGGFLALMGGLLMGLLIWLPRLWRSRAGMGVFLVLSVALALIGWFGLDQVATRLATLRSGDAIRESRLDIWAHVLPVARDFPLWGTGCGTYELADLLHRSDAVNADVTIDHAHNDYLEMLVVGGVAQLVPGVLAFLLVFRLGLRAVGRLGVGPAGGLALGALMGFATVAIHSFSDFGLHIPSCAALVVVMSALLCGLGHPSGGSGPGIAPSVASGDADRTVLRLRGLAPAALGAGSVLALGLFVAHEGWRAYRVDQIRHQASDLDRSGDPARLDRKAGLLEAAARLVPEDARLRLDLAFAHLAAFEQRMYELAGDEPDGGVAAATAPDPDEVARARREHLAPALRHLLRSRDLCPLRALVHLEIADRVADFAAAGPRAAYLERAKLLAPADPDLWYRCGLHELADGRPDRAWASWRRSLALSNLHLPEILERSLAALGPRDTIRRVLPDRPDVLLAAAQRLDPGTDEGRRPFLERALALLDRGPGPPAAVDLHLKATLYRDLGRPADALATYRAALLREPMRLDWRFECAELAYGQGRYVEAHKELLTILALEPEDARARTLLDAVARGLAEHRSGPGG